MSALDLTREWLHTVLRPYTARERIVSEVMDILSSRRTLSVKTDAFTFDTGQTALLLLLHGTLPINYRGATYQIPLNVWIPHDYPRTPPLAFVVPTKEMGVRKGREVEPGGRVKDDIIQGWWSGWEPKSIEVLLRHLTGVFSATPPVFARPPENIASPVRQNSQPSGSNGYPAAGPSHQPPPPPARPSYQPPTQQPYTTPSPTEYLPQYHSAPTPPPHHYPQQTTQNHLRQSSATYPQSPGSPLQPNGVPPVPYRPQVGIPPRQGSLPPSSPGGTSSSGSGPVMPPRPYMPPMQHEGMPGGGSRAVSGGCGPPPVQMGGMDRYGSSSNGGPSGQITYQPQQPMGQNYTGVPAQQIHPGHQTNGYQNPAYNAPPQPFNAPGQPPIQQNTQRPGPPARGQASQPTQIPDLMSSSDSATLSSPPGSAPPPLPTTKPPNPSTLHLHSILLPHLNASLPQLLASLHASKTHLLERKDHLNSGEPAIRDEMARLEAVLKVCETTAGKLGEVVSKGEARIGELESRGEVGVDEVVCGISIVHNQLIDLVAEDNAIDDTIYHITKAFEAERLDLDRFLKSIRSLAREQYMKRALIERILHGMGQKQGW